MRNQAITVILAAGLLGTGLAATAIAQSPKADEMGQGQNKPQQSKSDPSEMETRVNVLRSAQFGDHLVDQKGNSLYVFTADQPGVSRCDAACAKAWPPLTTTTTAKAAVESLDARKLGTITRSDGTKQITFGGQPLYRYAGDRGPDVILGQAVHGFGGAWYLVAPDGQRIKGERPPTAGGSW